MSTHSSADPPPLEETKRIVQLIAAQPRCWIRAALAQEFAVSTRQIDKDLQLIRHGLRYALQRSWEGYYFEHGRC